MSNPYTSLINSHILGLNTKEISILSVLGGSLKHLLVSEISKQTAIPRTTLYPILETLNDRGLIKLQKQKQHTRAYAVGLEKIKEDLVGHIGTQAYIPNKKEENNKEVSKKAEAYVARWEGFSIRIDYDMQVLSEEYASMATLSKNERYYCIQPNAAAKEVLKRLTPAGIANACKRIKDRHIIIDAILQNNSIDKWLKDVKELGIPDDDRNLIIKEFSGRMADTHYVPNEFLNSKAEMWINSDRMRFFDWADGVLIEITSKEIVTIIKDLYKMAKIFGKKVDQNAMLDSHYEDRAGI